MKTSLLACIVTIVLLSSCGSAKTETNTTQDSNTNISEISEEKLIGSDCQDLSEKTQLALVEKNTNPDVSFEFLGAIYVENQASCYLQVKIESAANPGTPVYSLFNVVSEKTYRSFDSLEAMNQEIESFGKSASSSSQETDTNEVSIDSEGGISEGSEGTIPASTEIAPNEWETNLNEIEKQMEEQRQASQKLDFVGLTEEAAAALATENNVSFRVTMRDAIPLPVTMDYRPGRINADVESGVVVSVSVE